MQRSAIPNYIYTHTLLRYSYLIVNISRLHFDPKSNALNQRLQNVCTLPSSAQYHCSSNLAPTAESLLLQSKSQLQHF